MRCMSEHVPTDLSPLKRAYIAIEQFQARLEASERRDSEPIAVIGLGCRFPGGGDNPDLFWQSLQNGVEGTGELPADRWVHGANASAEAIRRGGFLPQVDS